MSTPSDEDHFILGYRNAPDPEQLQAMSYIELCCQLEDAKPGTTRFMLLAAEKQKRDSVQPAEPAHSEPNRAVQPAGEVPNKSDWYERPLGKLWLGLVGTALGAIVLYLLKTYVGVG